MSESIYLDYMASTPLDPSVIKAMQQAMAVYANPASLHPAGLEAHALVEKARVQVAQAIQASPEAIIWTSGATESNNLAIRGAAYFYRRQGGHIITLQTEHKAVLQVMQLLEKDGFDITYLVPQSNGLLDLAKLKQALRSDTILVSVMWVNNETGVIQPMAEIASFVKNHGALLHVDAAQALGKLPINLAQLPIDLLTLAAHKAYGPKGVGALFVRQKPLVRLQPLFAGSGQEFGLRPGTVATLQVVGMGAACACLVDWQDECRRIQALKDRFVVGLKKLPGVGLYAQTAPTVPHCLAFYVLDISMEALLARLPDLMIATGSACNSATPEPSAVLLAMDVPMQQADNSGRISLGRFTTEAEVDRSLARIEDELRYLRAVAPGLPESVAARAPFLHAYKLANATHEYHWSSATEEVEWVLFARVEDEVVQEFSFLLRGGPAWFALLDAFCNQFAGQAWDRLRCLDKETAMLALQVSPMHAHRVHALLAAIQRLRCNDGPVL